MTERRRFFPGTPAQRVPGRTVDLAMRLQRVPEVAAAVAQLNPGGAQPPVWAGWFDDADAPATDIQLGTYVDVDGLAHNRFAVGPVVAHVVGGVDVEWDVSFLPRMWDSSGSVLWTGDVLESTLPRVVLPGDDPTPPTRAIALPTFGENEPGMYWPHEWRAFGDYGIVHEPLMVAAGNTLSVALEAGGCPGLLDATARIGATVLGTVRLTAYLRVNISN